MNLKHALIAAFLLSVAPFAATESHAKECKDGYKWSKSAKKCVLDPFGGSTY